MVLYKKDEDRYITTPGGVVIDLEKVVPPNAWVIGKQIVYNPQLVKERFDEEIAVKQMEQDCKHMISIGVYDLLNEKGLIQIKDRPISISPPEVIRDMKVYVYPFSLDFFDMLVRAALGDKHAQSKFLEYCFEMEEKAVEDDG